MGPFAVLLYDLSKDVWLINHRLLASEHAASLRYTVHVPGLVTRWWCLVLKSWADKSPPCVECIHQWVTSQWLVQSRGSSWLQVALVIILSPWRKPVIWPLTVGLMTYTSLFPRSVSRSFLGQDTEAQIQLVIVRVWVWAWLLESAEVTESSAVCRCELLNVTWSKNTQSNNTNMFHVSRAEKWNTRPLYQPINHFMLIRGNAQSVENTYHLLLLSFGRSLHAWIVTFHLILSMHPWPSSELLPWSGPSAASWFSFFPCIVIM